MTTAAERADFIEPGEIEGLLEGGARPSRLRVRELLAKAREMHGLSMEEVACLTLVEDPELLAELFSTAKSIKEEIYGSRLVFFAPLYISNRCANECTYCAFRATNAGLKRRTLTQEEIAEETRILIRQGHKRVLVVAGEALPPRGFRIHHRFHCDDLRTRRWGQARFGASMSIWRPQNVERFKLLKQAGIGTFQLFQETYHRPTYASVHLKGKKRDYDWRATAFDRAMEAGIDDVGMGLLFGLYDWRFEVLSMMQHIRHLEENLRRRSAHAQFSAHRTGSGFDTRRCSSACRERCRFYQDDCDHASRGAVHGHDHVDTRGRGGAARRRSRSAFRRFRRGAALIPADTKMAKAILTAASSS